MSVENNRYYTPWYRHAVGILNGLKNTLRKDTYNNSITFLNKWDEKLGTEPEIFRKNGSSIIFRIGVNIVEINDKTAEYFKGE